MENNFICLKGTVLGDVEYSHSVQDEEFYKFMLNVARLSGAIDSLPITVSKKLLDENEIKIGLKQETIDCSKIELLLREQFHQLGWVSVYLEHTNLCIEVKESLYDVIGYSEDVSGRMFHLIANKEGRISSIVTRAGKAVVKEGQIVKPGDILVLGHSEIFDDNGEVKETLYLKADASIYADVMYHMDIPLTEMELAALKLAGKHEESLLLGLGYQKLMHVIEQMQNVQILDKTSRDDLMEIETNPF